MAPTSKKPQSLPAARLRAIRARLELAERRGGITTSPWPLHEIRWLLELAEEALRQRGEIS